MKRITTFSLAAAFAVVTPISAAQAAPIVGLFNTGTDANNDVLVGGDGITDTHYQVLSSTSAGFVAGGQAVTFKHPNYAANDANSRWISLSATGTPGSNTTVYRTTFDMTGLDTTTASLSGLWGADNQVTLIFNGVNTGLSLGLFDVLLPFNLSSGFVAGINTLDFSVVDVGSPTALRVDDMRGSANPSSVAVPEPATWVMMIAGFGLTGGAMRLRRRTAVLA